MRRIYYFVSGLPLGSKLQFAAMGMILAWIFISIDLKNHLLGIPLWQVTGSLILGTFVIGRLLMPLMVRYPTQAQRALWWFGMLVFCLGLYSSTLAWRRVMIVHLGLTMAMWLDASCWFWFISEVQRRATQTDGPVAIEDEDNSQFYDEDRGR
jgi:hypothetical protein